MTVRHQSQRRAPKPGPHAIMPVCPDVRVLVQRASGGRWMAWTGKPVSPSFQMARVPGWWKSRKGAISGAMRFVRAASPGPHWLPRWPPPIGHRTACVRCGGKLGPDITGRPICYGCGPSKMMPAGKLRDAAMEREQCDAQDPKGLAR